MCATFPFYLQQDQWPFLLTCARGPWGDSFPCLQGSPFFSPPPSSLQVMLATVKGGVESSCCLLIYTSGKAESKKLAVQAWS